MTALIRRAVLISLGLAVFLVAPAAAQYQAPFGIPAPSFGINENAPASPNPWTVATPGFYYVDATKAAATDSGNPNGTPARPRRTIPTELAAGSVVELHGTYDERHTSPRQLVSRGTASRPVFVRGASADARPSVRSGWYVSGTYLIVENLDFGPADASRTGSIVVMGQQWDPGTTTHHIAVRYNDIHGNSEGGGAAVESWYGESNNVVFYRNTIRDNGNINAGFDQDVHCLHVGEDVNYIWVLENELARCSGDGIQINATVGKDESTHHIFVGKNISHHNKQSGFWVKQATDVIFSQNLAYAERPSDSGIGPCFGAQYGTRWVWYLYNHAHDCEYGIVQVSDGNQGAGGLQSFFIGNVIHNIHRTTIRNSADDAWGASAIMMVGGYERYVIGNSIYDVDSGINSPSPYGVLEIANNIISNISQPRGNHINIAFQSLADRTVPHHNLFFGDPRVSWAGSVRRLNQSEMGIVKSVIGDPQFVDANGEDFHIRTSSPAVGKGEGNNVYAIFRQRYGKGIEMDFDGKARTSGTTDIGAYLASGSAAPPDDTPPPPPPAPPPPGGPGCVATQTPGPPTALTLDKQGGGSVTMSWTKPESCGVPTSYVLEGGVVPGGDEMGTKVTPDASVTKVTGPLPPGTFYARVKAQNAGGLSAPSNEIQIGGVPGPPRNLKVKVDGRNFTVTWDPPDSGGTAAGYIAESGSKPGQADYGTILTEETTISGPGSHDVYYIRVKAASISGVSQPSNEVFVTIKK